LRSRGATDAGVVLGEIGLRGGNGRAGIGGQGIGGGQFVIGPGRTAQRGRGGNRDARGSVGGDRHGHAAAPGVGAGHVGVGGAGQTVAGWQVGR